MSRVPIKRRESKRIKSTFEFSYEDWKALTKYLYLRSEDEIQNKILYLANTGPVSLYDGADSSDGLSESERDIEEGRLETLRHLCEQNQGLPNHYFGEGRQSNASLAEQSTKENSNSNRSTGKPGGKMRRVETEICAFLDDNLVCPPENCRLIEEYRQNNYIKFYNNRDKEFASALTFYNNKIFSMSLYDIYNHYKDKNLYFKCLTKNLDSMYFSREYSLKWLEYLLLQQFNCKERADEFMTDLYLLLTHQSEKKNCISIVGERDAGKSYLIESVGDLCITYGSTTVMNKTDNFCMSSLINKKLIILDEVTYDSIYAEKLKLLFSGNPCTVAVKYENAVEIKKTPVICMSNAERFPDIDIWNCRIKRFVWRKIEFTDIYSDDTYFNKEDVEMFKANKYIRKIHPFAIIDYWKCIGLWKDNIE
jgi:Papillomavirus helicase